jgi:hypothetical protein
MALQRLDALPVTPGSARVAVEVRLDSLCDQFDTPRPMPFDAMVAP